VHRLPVALALEAVGDALAACEHDGLHVSAMVLDTDGIEIATAREDGSGVRALGTAREGACRGLTCSARPKP